MLAPRFLIDYIHSLPSFLFFLSPVNWRAVAQKNPSVQYYAGVGVNTYVCVLLSFLPPAQTRSTRAVPCSFCPEFGHHTEFLCHLITQKSTGEASSLGELLQSASIVFSVYHQSTKSGKDNRCAIARIEYWCRSPLNFSVEKTPTYRIME